MKKNYLFTLAALLLGSTIANAQNPLDGYEAPSFTAEAWNDLRRTGYPRIFPVNDIGDGSLGKGRMIRRIPWNMTDAAAAQDVNTSGIQALGGSNLMRTTLWWDVEDPAGLGDNRRWETEVSN